MLFASFKVLNGQNYKFQPSSGITLFIHIHIRVHFCAEATAFVNYFHIGSSHNIQRRSVVLEW